MDFIDLAILRELQADGRIANNALSQRVGLSESPCLRRVRQLEADGTIRGYHADIDREKVGLELTVFVGVTVDRHQEETASHFEAWASERPEVVACYLVSGEMDFLLEVVVSSVADYEQFMTKQLWRLPHVKDVRSNFAMRVSKRVAALPLPSGGKGKTA